MDGKTATNAMDILKIVLRPGPTSEDTGHPGALWQRFARPGFPSYLLVNGHAYWPISIHFQ